MDERLSRLRQTTDLTEDDLQYVLETRSSAIANGDKTLEGEALLTLSYVVKWVRSDTDEPPFDRSLSLATAALAALRESGDKPLLLSALLNQASPFRSPEQNEALLSEAWSVATELGDEIEKAWVLAKQSLFVRSSDRTKAAEMLQEALSIFERHQDLNGIAKVRWSMALSGGDGKERRDNALIAAELFKQLGYVGEAARALSLSTWHCDDLSIEEREELARNALVAWKLAHVGPPQAALKILGEAFEAKGDTRFAQECQELLEALEADGIEKNPKTQARLQDFVGRI